MTRLERKKRIKIILPYLKKEWKILDCACGDGWLTNYLNEKGYNCVGIDKFKNINGNKLFNFDAMNMPFQDNTFDCIVSIQTLEHTLCENEMSRVLKKDGLFLVEVPRWDFPFWILDFFGLIQQGIKWHIRKVNFYNLYPFKLISNSVTGFGLCKFGVFKNIKWMSKK